LDIIGSRRAFYAGAGVVLILAAIALLYVFFGGASKPSYARFAHGGLAYLHVLEAPPPQLSETLYDADGGTHHLSDYRGRAILVNVWATWCLPCVEELPTLGALQRRFQGRLTVVTISADDASKRAQAASELSRLSAGSLAFLQDPTRNVLFDVGGGVVPTTILYDGEGRERARVTGKADWSSPEALAFIDAVLQAHEEAGPARR
jgi:thiol-disulfide isomerase/thioredoxin